MPSHVQMILGALALASSALQPAAGQGIKEPKGSKVSVLNKDLFPRFIARNPLVLMEWYAPWCGHCQELAPRYREAAEQLAKLKKAGEIPRAVKLAKMDDADEYNREGRFGAPDMYNFSSYPALYVFEDGEMKDPYYGGREVEDIVFWMASLSKGLDPIEEEVKQRPGLYKKKTDALPDLSFETFNATVKRPAAEGNNAVYIVEFYSDRCPFCISLSPDIIVAAEKVRGEVPNAIVAACNSRIYGEVARSNGVTGYPWVAAFYNGEKVEDMAGLGGADSIVSFAKRVTEEVFNEGLGARPGSYHEPWAYDEEGLVVLDEATQKWRDQDAGRWKAIEDAKLADEAARGAEAEAAPKPEAKAEAKAAPKPAAAAPKAAAAKAQVVASGEVQVAVAEASLEPTQEDIDKGAMWRAKLGRQTWFFLHTLAAKYPDYPSEVDQRTMRNFVAALGQHYPCKLCRAHLQLKLADPALGPVRVENRTALALWFCQLHNMVNLDTGKTTASGAPYVHECSAFKLDLEYLKDCGECEGPGSSKAESGKLGESAVDDHEVLSLLAALAAAAAAAPSPSP